MLDTPLFPLFCNVSESHHLLPFPDRDRRTGRQRSAAVTSAGRTAETADRPAGREQVRHLRARHQHSAL